MLLVFLPVGFIFSKFHNSFSLTVLTTLNRQSKVLVWIVFTTGSSSLLSRNFFSWINNEKRIFYTLLNNCTYFLVCESLFWRYCWACLPSGISVSVSARSPNRPVESMLSLIVLTWIYYIIHSRSRTANNLPSDEITRQNQSLK